MAEEANVAEIQRLASSAAEMQAELAFRPTRSDIDDLTAVVGKLRAEVLARDQQIERLRTSTVRERSTQDKAVHTGDSLEDLRADSDSAEPTIDAGKISAEIDEMFRLDYDDDDDETDSAVTEINRDDSPAGEASGYVRLDDEARLHVTLHNGSLHALEEELVRAKERWAEVCGERARLAAQLAALRKPPRRPALRLALALCVPLLAAALYYLLLPHAS